MFFFICVYGQLSAIKNLLLLLLFKESWFALSHRVNFFSSSFNVSSVMFGSLKLQNKVVSSA